MDQPLHTQGMVSVKQFEIVAGCRYESIRLQVVVRVAHQRITKLEAFLLRFLNLL